MFFPSLTSPQRAQSAFMTNVNNYLGKWIAQCAQQNDSEITHVLSIGSVLLCEAPCSWRTKVGALAWRVGNGWQSPVLCIVLYPPDHGSPAGNYSLFAQVLDKHGTVHSPLHLVKQLQFCKQVLTSSCNLLFRRNVGAKVFFKGKNLEIS